MPRYKIEIAFTSDKELDPNELLNLENAILLQIEEPTDYDQESEQYETSEAIYAINKENNL